MTSVLLLRKFTIDRDDEQSLTVYLTDEEVSTVASLGPDAAAEMTARIIMERGYECP